MAIGTTAAILGSAVIGGALSMKSSKDAAKATANANQAQIEANAVDPRITNMLFGNGTKSLKPGATAQWTNTPGPYGSNTQTMTNPESDYNVDGGLLGRFESQLDKPQSAGLNAFGRRTDQYLGFDAGEDRNFLRETAYKQMNANTAAPGMAAASSGAAMPGAAIAERR